MTTTNPGKLTRRDFFKVAGIAGGLLAAGGAGLRLVHDLNGRDFHDENTQAWLASIQPAAAPGDLPNIILINADDLGYGDLGCYGSQAIHTPNLDRLAAEGTCLTEFYACAPLCSPSRAGLMTGRYPIRTHVTMPLYPAGAPLDIAFNALGVYNYGVRGIPQDEILLPEVLKRRGYQTALLGKWHLGDRSPSLPNDRGFDLFYGALFSNDMPPYEIYRNQHIEIPAPADQDQLTTHLTREALDFIRQNKNRPFFLYYAQPFPHSPAHASPAFSGKSAAGLYGDAVEEIDWSIGEILKSLQELQLEHKTLVIFTSDNGPWWQGAPGGLRGRKNLAFEGGLRVPLIARWPGVMPTGQTIEGMASNLDFLPTLLKVAGAPLPADRIIDGKDILPMLQGLSGSPHEQFLYYKGSSMIGMRYQNWKYMRRHMTDNGGYASLRQGPFLFNLETDPSESYSLIESHPQIAAQMVARMEAWDGAIRENRRGWE
ncbi:MAG: sulfatase [Chloroflexota bacterium]